MIKTPLCKAGEPAGLDTVIVFYSSEPREWIPKGLKQKDGEVASGSRSAAARGISKVSDSAGVSAWESAVLEVMVAK